MFGDWSTSFIIILLVLLGIFYYSQARLQGKLFCTFHRGNLTKVEKFVPLHSKHVAFKERRRGEVGYYEVRTSCIELIKYTRGVNKLFPAWVPSIEFRSDTPNPIDPRTGKPTWHTPEFRAAAYQEHDYKAFARAQAQQAGIKVNPIERYLPLVLLGGLIIVGYLVYQMAGDIAYLGQELMNKGMIGGG